MSCCPAPQYSPATAPRAARPEDGPPALQTAVPRAAPRMAHKRKRGASQRVLHKGVLRRLGRGGPWPLPSGRFRSRAEQVQAGQSPGGSLCRKVGRGGGVGGPGSEPCPRGHGHAGLSPTRPPSSLGWRRRGSGMFADGLTDGAVPAQVSGGRGDGSLLWDRQGDMAHKDSSARCPVAHPRLRGTLLKGPASPRGTRRAQLGRGPGTAAAPTLSCSEKAANPMRKRGVCAVSGSAGAVPRAIISGRRQDGGGTGGRGARLEGFALWEWRHSECACVHTCACRWLCACGCAHVTVCVHMCLCLCVCSVISCLPQSPRELGEGTHPPPQHSDPWAEESYLPICAQEGGPQVPPPPSRAFGGELSSGRGLQGSPLRTALSLGTEAFLSSGHCPLHPPPAFLRLQPHPLPCLCQKRGRGQRGGLFVCPQRGPAGPEEKAGPGLRDTLRCSRPASPWAVRAIVGRSLCLASGIACPGLRSSPRRCVPPSEAGAGITKSGYYMPRPRLVPA